MRKLPTPLEWPLLRVVMLGLTGCLSIASAQADDQTGDSPRLEEIVVTAQKRAENLHDVPISISVVNGATLSSVNVSSEVALGRVTPDLSYTFSSDFVSPYIRGIGTQFAEPGLESSVATYIDDIYQSRASALVMGLADISQVEVLKGPQGTLYGRNATGGAIRIMTNDPTEKLEGDVSALGGSYGRQAYEGMVNIPITDKLFWRVSVQSDEYNGYVKATTPGVPNEGGVNNVILHSKLLWEPTDDFKAKLTVNYLTSHDREGQAFVNLDTTAPTQIGVALGGKPALGIWQYAGNAVPENRTKQLGISLRLDKTFEGFVVSSVSAVGDTSFIGFADLDTTSVPLEVAGENPETTTDYTQEFQLVTTGTGPWKTVGGLFYLYERGIDNFFVYGTAIDPTSNGVYGTVGNGSLLQTNYRIDASSIAPYGQTTYTFADHFDFTVGARYTHEKKYEPFHNLESVNPVLGTSTVLFSSAYQQGTFSKFTPKATFADRISNELMVYASFGQGFKSGGLNNPTFTPAIDYVKPEKLNAYELGSKYDTGRLRLSADVFYYDYKDLTVQFTDQVSGGTDTRNAANAKIKGVEIDSTIAITDQFTVGFGAAYLNAKYSNFSGADAQTYAPSYTTPACTAANPGGCLGYSVVSDQNFTGNYLTIAPKETGYLKLQYDLPLSSELGALHFIGLSSYTSKFYYSSDNALSEPSKNLLTASVLWDGIEGRYFVKLFGDNLTRREYNVWETRQSTGGWRVPGMPRTWGAQVGLKF